MSEFGETPEIPQPQESYDTYYRATIITDNADKRYAVGIPQRRGNDRKAFAIQIDDSGLPLPVGIREKTSAFQQDDLLEIHFSTDHNQARGEVITVDETIEGPAPMSLADMEKLIEGIIKRDWSNIHNRRNTVTLTTNAVLGVMDALSQSAMLQRALQNPDFLDEMITKIQDPTTKITWDAFMRGDLTDEQVRKRDERFHEIREDQNLNPEDAIRDFMPTETMDDPQVLAAILPEKFQDMDRQKFKDLSLILSMQLLPAMTFPIARQTLEEHADIIDKLGHNVDLETYLTEEALSQPHIDRPHRRRFTWPKKKK
jgi:hypothetical protein